MRAACQGSERVRARRSLLPAVRCVLQVAAVHARRSVCLGTRAAAQAQGDVQSAFDTYPMPSSIWIAKGGVAASGQSFTASDVPYDVVLITDTV